MRLQYDDFWKERNGDVNFRKSSITVNWLIRFMCAIFQKERERIKMIRLAGGQNDSDDDPVWADYAKTSVP